MLSFHIIDSCRQWKLRQHKPLIFCHLVTQWSDQLEEERQCRGSQGHVSSEKNAIEQISIIYWENLEMNYNAIFTMWIPCYYRHILYNNDLLLQAGFLFADGPKFMWTNERGKNDELTDERMNERTNDRPTRRTDGRIDVRKRVAKKWLNAFLTISLGVLF